MFSSLRPFGPLPVNTMLRAGVLSRLFRELNEPLPKAKEGKEMRWIIYDGDVDAVCHCVEINASRDLGPNLDTIPERYNRPTGASHTPRDHELKHKLTFAGPAGLGREHE